MSKRILSVILAVILALSTAAVAFAADDADVQKEQVIYFDAETAGWSDAQYVGFHIWEIGGNELNDWASKSERGTRVLEYDGDEVVETPALVWQFDFVEKGITLEDGRQYGVIFYNDKGAQTYNLLFGTECFGHTAQCDGEILENPTDSNKATQKAFWDDGIDPTVYGPELKVTSIGNVTGVCCPASTAPYHMFTDFLKNTLLNVRIFSGRPDQEIIDNVGKGLGLTADDVQRGIADTGVDVNWSYVASELDKAHPPIDPDKPLTLSFDAKSAGWEDSEWIGFHIYAGDNDLYREWGSKKEYGSDEDGDDVWTYTVTDYKTNRVWSESRYLIIFYNDKGDRTYPLVFDYTCFDDDVAYCKDGERVEAPSDSSQTVLTAYWRNQDPKENGPVIQITFAGEVIGESLPPRYSADYMLQEFLENHLDTARSLSGKSDQKLIDDIAGKLGIYAEVTDSVVYVLNYRGSNIEWREEDSPLERIWDPEKVHVSPEGTFWFIETDRDEAFVYELYAKTEEPFGDISGTVTFPKEAFAVADAQVLTPDRYSGEFSESEDGKLDFSLRLRDDAAHTDGESDYYVPLIALRFDTIADSGKYRIGTQVDFGEASEPDCFVDLYSVYYMRGDYDLDGDVTILDATRAQRILADIQESPKDALLAKIDADDDGELTIMDATRIQRVIAALCDWDGEPLDEPFDPTDWDDDLVDARDDYDKDELPLMPA